MTAGKAETPPSRPDRAPMDVRLFTIPGSHPGTAARLMLEYKGIQHKRTDLLPVASWVVLKALRFPGVRVPALKIDGRRVQGSREIARELDRIAPDPPLLPADPEHRAAVEEADRFGDEDLQQSVRQILMWMLRKDTAPFASYAVGSRIGVPIGFAVKTAGPFVAMDARSVEATDANVQRDISDFPEMLQRIDDWIAKGVLGGERLNVGDFQVATCLRLAMSLDDLRPSIEGRPAGELALRVVPDYPGRTPPTLPPAWLEPLHATA